MDSKKSKESRRTEEELIAQMDRLIKAEAIDEDGVKNQELYVRSDLTRKSAGTSRPRQRFEKQA